MYKRYLLALFLLISSTSIADTIHIYQKVDSLFFLNKMEMLQKKYGNSLTCPDKYKLQVLIALSYFPELTDVAIEVKAGRLSTTATCRPRLGSLLRRSEKRIYTIRINQKANFKGILLKNVPFNAQIGLIGHEIAHIADFEQRKLGGVIGRGLDYLTYKTKKAFEYQIDSLTIEHGLGWQLRHWADYAMYMSAATRDYKRFKRRTYMTPSEIETYMSNLPIYGENALYRLAYQN